MVPLSKPFDGRTYARLLDAWKDPELTIAMIAARFGVTPKDVKALRLALGDRPKPAPYSPWWRADRTRRVRRGWA
jgi:hypothetical protein